MKSPLFLAPSARRIKYPPSRASRPTCVLIGCLLLTSRAIALRSHNVRAGHPRAHHARQRKAGLRRHSGTTNCTPDMSQRALDKAMYHFNPVLPGYDIRLKPGDDGGGRVVTIWREPGSSHGLLYRDHAPNSAVDSVSAWSAPASDSPVADGIVVQMGMGATGKSKLYHIIAGMSNGRFKLVLSAESINDDYGRPLESVDLDGDTYPELISVPEYVWRYGPNWGWDLADTKAIVWKWSPARLRYVRVALRPYLQRLAPLRLHGFR